MYRERSNGDSKLVKAMRKCQRTHSPPQLPASPEYAPPPRVLSFVSYPYECYTSQNSCARCCRAQIRVSCMSQAILIAGIEYLRSSEMQSRYFDDDLPGQGFNVDDFIGPGGRRVKCLSGLAN